MITKHLITGLGAAAILATTLALPATAAAGGPCDRGHRCGPPAWVEHRRFPPHGPRIIRERYYQPIIVEQRRPPRGYYQEFRRPYRGHYQEPRWSDRGRNNDVTVIHRGGWN